MKCVVKRLTETEKQLKDIHIYLVDYKGILVGINYNANPNRLKLPENSGLYSYQIRHSDEDCGLPVELSNHVLVNFYGTIISTDEIDLPYETNIKGQLYDIIDMEVNDLVEYYHTTSAYDLLYNKSKVIDEFNGHFEYPQYTQEGFINE